MQLTFVVKRAKQEHDGILIPSELFYRFFSLKS